jgi:hypothetical protein
MNINIMNFARHGDLKELRWFVGRQVPLWIQDMLKRKAAGEDPATLIDELAEVCCVNEKTELLP